MDYVYLLKNKVTKRIYVGRTCCPQRRYRQHITALKAQRHKNELMQLDFNTYGEETFEMEVVEKHENVTRKGIEGKWMLKLRTYDRKYGYNYKDPFIWSRHGFYTSNVFAISKL